VKLLYEAQQEQLKEIVGHLVQTRKEKSLSIEEMAMKTLIRPALLQALEEGRFEDLPEPIFVQGFILRYGDALGLNGSSLAGQFIKISDPPELKEITPEVEQKTNIYIPIFLPYIVLVAFASLVLFYILNSSRKAETIGHSTNQSSNSKQVNQVKANPAKKPPTSAAKPTPKPVASPKPTAPKQLEASLEFEGESWVRVVADGQKVFEGTLDKGAKKTWTAKKRLFIRSGNAGVVLLSTNKQKAKILGEQGEIQEVVLTNESKPPQKNPNSEPSR
jgi:cytoskeletal protein RodZ